MSYDDRYISFFSDDNIYVLDLSSGEYTQLTSDNSDMYPQFGIDNKIYFAHFLGEDYDSALMRMDVDGNNLEEVCQLPHAIQQIFPGQSDTDIIYFICYNRKFMRLQISSGECIELHEFSSTYDIVTRTEDDRYFNFSRRSKTQYLYDTQTDICESYYYPVGNSSCAAKIFPDRKEALIYNYHYGAILMIWDIENNIQIGEDIIVGDTDLGGHSEFAISPNGQKAAIIQRTE